MVADGCRLQAALLFMHRFSTKAAGTALVISEDGLVGSLGSPGVAGPWGSPREFLRGFLGGP